MFSLCFIFLVFQVALGEVCFLLVAFHWKAGALSMSGCAQLSPLLPQARNSVQSAQEASLSHWLLTEKLDGSRKTHKVNFFSTWLRMPCRFPNSCAVRWAHTNLEVHSQWRCCIFGWPGAVAGSTSHPPLGLRAGAQEVQSEGWDW